MYLSGGTQVLMFEDLVSLKSSVAAKGDKENAPKLKRTEIARVPLRDMVRRKAQYVEHARSTV